MIEPFYVEVGHRIRDFRTKRGLTQEQLGQLLNPKTSRVSVANVESGKQRILAHTLIQYAESLKVEPALLLPPSHTTDFLPGGDRAIADELVNKAGLSKSDAKKLMENPRNLKEWSEEQS